MKDHSRQEHEIAAILMAAVAGEATPQQLQQLNDSIRRDPTLAPLAVDLMGQEFWLTWQVGGQVGRDRRYEAPGHPRLAIDPAHAAPGYRPQPALRSGSPVNGRSTAPRADRQTNASASVLPLHLFRFKFAAAAALLVAIGALLGSIATRQFSQPEFPAVAIDLAPQEELPSEYVARVVPGTSCIWTAETVSAVRGEGALGAGESLSLLEGLAELAFDWTTGNANVKLEGPAVLILSAERGANLTRGRMTADFHLADGAFALGTPNGNIEIGQDASIGVVVHGEDVELHVFRGAATLITSWGGAGKNERLVVAAGDSIKISSERDGRMQLRKCEAQPKKFASQISMRSDNLNVSPEYVAEILRGKPSLYWRFEGEDSQVVRNEAGDHGNGRVVGSIQWIDQQDNGNVELGDGLVAEELHAYIISDEPLTDDFSNGYSIEMWIKPSHYHWGTIASLIGDPLQPGWQNVHGMLFELGGPIASPSAIEQPGRLRFLHRSPASDDSALGTSCFSERPYALRKWQHVAAVKDGAHMRLYVDGQLVAAGDDPTPLPNGLRLLIGQLDQNRDNRRFIGQIDELAVFPRPLSDNEIGRRFELLRTPEKSGVESRRSDVF